MATLVIDTATAACSVALIESDRLLANIHEIVGRGHAERLVPMIGELIERRERPDAVLVDVGPGSFTGVRVGLAAARAFGLAWSVPVKGYSSLVLLARMAAGQGPRAVAIPGGHGELFVQRFMDPVTPLGPLVSLAPAEAARFVHEDPVFGEGAAALTTARGGGTAVPLLPDAAAARWLPADAANLPPRPIYGRAPDARLPG
ncbi:tRNA threonylcarbamoyl adenosine modification protein YeaZ [Sphingomonas vulcanisoli]|uniref:tRNA threonylcarbamoyl adenosine modification protein YeaZ n=1 Tax=Sphingomonas vulcanisoli TaxID=1658060 RepID=A0ABX0TWK6_9SPHN|nr:tRNA (adenosine(37)-N6)-threonylcarbamoyltransferase complex dimerization subunit type 1 TsaB [Sphingomonas vulcanisoli]NIJ08787.1 tRNA threonylcarbamoyl adenosine modification protein YeaZ [Sphingomonas vulcanisoli]